ncbi:MAG TPA: hypothetical protein VH186_38235 [Chloroflexia bacterium]|nr:hypothetical protein [Chloroflexia bacterium]
MLLYFIITLAMLFFASYIAIALFSFLISFRKGRLDIFSDNPEDFKRYGA